MGITSKLSAIADAIREKTGESGALSLDAMAAAIAGIEASGGGFGSTDFDVSYGSIIPASEVNGLTVTLNFTLSPTDSCVLAFFGAPIASDRSVNANLAAYCVRNIPDGAIISGNHGVAIYASASASRPSSSTSNVINEEPDGTNVFLLRGYGLWSFTPHYEYFWIAAKKKVSA